MKTPIAKKDFFINNKFYSIGDEVKERYDDVVKMNEKGLIEPLSYKELLELKTTNKKKEKEDKKDGEN